MIDGGEPVANAMEFWMVRNRTLEDANMPDEPARFAHTRMQRKAAGQLVDIPAQVGGNAGLSGSTIPEEEPPVGTALMDEPGNRDCRVQVEGGGPAESAAPTSALDGMPGDPSEDS